MMKVFLSLIVVLCCCCKYSQALVRCPEIACILGGVGDGCINTAEVDEHGCTRCVCKPLPVICPDIACILGGGSDGCINTFEIDENGCTRCVCKPFPACPMLDCQPCPYGRVVDDKGCETCECKDPCSDFPCLPTQACYPSPESPLGYRCVSCCPAVKLPFQVRGPSHPPCLLDCSLVDCFVGYSCCPDRYGCHSCYKSKCHG